MAKTSPGIAVVALLTIVGCSVDSGPTQTASEQVEVGKAEAVKAEITMGAGELNITGGGSRLLTGSFRYSEKVGRPSVKYEVTGTEGRLVVESPRNSTSSGKTVNQWELQMGSDAPLDLTVALGAGESKLDLSQLPVRSVEVNMGAGEMTLNMDGRYKRDVTVEVNGGVGEARIGLPKDVGAEVEATGGIGEISTKGLTKRDGKYYNDAYAEGKPTVRMKVQGGIGNIILSVGSSNAGSAN